MEHTNKNLLKASILTMSLVQLGTNGIGPILSDIAASFPNTSDTTVQFLMTFPILFTMIFEIFSALLAEKLPKKLLSISGLALVGLGGVMAFLFHGSLTLMFVWEAVIGIGLGMVAPVAPALINENFREREKQVMLGWQNSASTIGSMIMTFACGFLAAAGWNYGYLIYLIGVPGIIFALIGLHETRHMDPALGGQPKDRGRFRLTVWREMVIAAVFLMVYSAVPANLSMLVVEKGAGDSSTAGILTTLFSLAGMLVGLIFGILTRYLKRFTNTAGALLFTIGAFILGTCRSLPVMIIGCMIAGFSMSLIMPVCMGAASRLPGYEIINAALIMSSTSVGIFITPLITSATAAVTGSDSVSYRFIALALFGIVLTILTIVLHDRKQRHI